MWGKLNLPMLLFKVGLLTLIEMDSFIFLAKLCPSLPNSTTPSGKNQVDELYPRQQCQTKPAM